MRKAIALLITISVILLITAIIYKSYNTSSKLIKKGLSEVNFYIQINQTTYDIVNNLNTYIKNKSINDFEDLDEYFLSQATIPIIYEKIGFKITISCKAADKAFNPNINYDDNNISLVSSILERYGVLEPQILTNIIADTIDKDFDERESGSEIVFTNPLFRQGRIENFEHFNQILQRYIKITEDFTIKKIKFDKIFSFNSGLKGEYLRTNFNYADNILISALSDGTRGINTLSEDDIKDIKKKKKILRDDKALEKESIDIKFLSAGSYIALCKSNISIKEAKAKLSFLYDTKKQKAYNFDIYQIY